METKARRKITKDERLARDYKRAGGTKESYIEMVTRLVDVAAKEQQWRPSERAARLGELQMIAERVWK